MYNQQNGTNGNQKERSPMKERNTLAKLPITERTEVHVNEVITEDGKRHIDIRNWYTTRFDPLTPRPSKSGIWMPAELAEHIGEALTKYANSQKEKEKEAITHE